MHRFRSFTFLSLLVFFAVGFTACRKVHPASEQAAFPHAAPHAAPEVKPIVVAANDAALEPFADESDKEDVNNIHLEVAALESINHFKLTRSQLEQLRKLAASMARKAAPVRALEVGGEFYKALAELRDALIDDNEARVAALTVALDEVREKENPEFADIEITAEARKRTPEVLHGLGARQVMGYLSDFSEEFPDPRDKIDETFDEIRTLKGKEWEELRDETAGQVAWLIAGLDAAAESRVRQRVVALLNRVHPMKDEEFSAKQEELSKQVEEIVGKVGPIEVIHHFTERSVAELLSNPRLKAAVEARLKKVE